jgi:hypothetical protein
MTLAAWTGSAAEFEQYQVATSGDFVASSSVADAPFIDATIITTNPRWMISENLGTATTATREAPAANDAAPSTPMGVPPATHAASSTPLSDRRTQLLEHSEPTTVDGVPGAADAAPVPLTDRRTQILEADGPGIAVSDQETALLGEDDRSGSAAAPPLDMVDQQTALIGEADRGGGRPQSHEEPVPLVQVKDDATAPVQAPGAAAGAAKGTIWLPVVLVLIGLVVGATVVALILR